MGYTSELMASHYSLGVLEDGEDDDDDPVNSVRSATSKKGDERHELRPLLPS